MVRSSSRPHSAPASRPWRSAWALPWAVLGLSLLLTGLVTYWGLQEAAGRRRARFEAAAGAVMERLEVRMEAHVGLLRGAMGLFLGSAEVTRLEFHAYAEQLML